MKESRRRLRRGIAAAVVVIALTTACAVYARRVDWHAACALMMNAAPGKLALAFVFHGLALTAKAGVWWVCLRAIGAPAFTTVARVTVVGATLNSLFIGNSGDAGRVVLISRANGMRSSAALASVALERLLGVGGFLVVLAASALALPLAVPHARETLGGAAVVLAAVPAAVIAARRRAIRVRSVDAARRAGMPRLLRIARVQVRRTMLAVRRIGTRRRLAAAGAFVLADWACEIVSYHLVARAADLPIPLAGSVLALLAVNAGLVVRVTPGNVGLFELSYAAAAVAQGAAPGAALAVGMLLHLVQDVPTIVLGLVLGGALLRPMRGTRISLDPAPHPSARGGISP